MLRFETEASRGTQDEAGVLNRWLSESRAFLPIWSPQFPPLAKGGLGGVDSALPNAPEHDSLARTRRTVSPSPPPLTPPSQGGEKERTRVPRNSRIDWRGWITLAWVAWFGLLYGRMILESRGAKIVEMGRLIGIRWF